MRTGIVRRDQLGRGYWVQTLVKRFEAEGEAAFQSVPRP